VRTRDNFGQEASDSFSFEVLPATPAETATLLQTRALEPTMPTDKATVIPD
jgi:hypothetical protein